MTEHQPILSGSASPAAFAAKLMFIFTLAALLLISFAPSDGPGDREELMATSAMAAQDEIPPVADAGDNFTAYVDFPAVLNGSLSEDDVGITSYIWTFTDGTNISLTGQVVEHEFSTPGNYTVLLNVSDAEGNWDTDTVLVTVTEDSTPPVPAPGYNTIEFVGREHRFDGSRSADPETGIVSWTWTISKDEMIETLEGEVVYFTFRETGNYTVTLTVTNGVGVSSSASITVTVEKEASWLSQNWGGVLVAAILAGGIAAMISRRWFKNHALLTSTEREKLRLRYKEFSRIWGLLKANRLGFAGFVVLCIFVGMAILAPVIATVKDPSASANQETSELFDNPSPPSLTPSPYTGFIHPFGTDVIGQDVYSLTVYGARASLMVGFVATFISVVLGVTVGLLSGYYGKTVDEVLMRFTDYFLVLPWFPLMIVLMTVLGKEFIWVIVVIGITSWPSTARIVRSQVLTVKERAFIERARAIGAGDLHIIRNHVFPNVLPLVFANTVLLISLAIFSEAFLDFFGLGDPDVISWGTMLELAYNFGAFDSGSWWWVLPPSLSIILCVLAFSLVGYALDDIFNPKLRRR